MNKQQLIKLSREFDEQLNQFVDKYFDDKDTDNLDDYDTELGFRIDAVYKSLRRLRLRLAKGLYDEK
jgi:hypothetical protein